MIDMPLGRSENILGVLSWWARDLRRLRHVYDVVYSEDLMWGLGAEVRIFIPLHPLLPGGHMRLVHGSGT